MPSELSNSKLKLREDAPLPIKQCTFLVAASKYRANASPPIPVEQGSVTLRAAAMATAVGKRENVTYKKFNSFHIPPASAALPPLCKIFTPAAVACGCDDVQIPFVDRTGERLLFQISPAMFAIISVTTDFNYCCVYCCCLQSGSRCDSFDTYEVTL